MLKFPSISTLWTSLRNILLRFPLQSFIALLAMSLWLSVADNYAGENVNMIHKLIALSLVAFTSSLSIALFAESRKLTPLRSVGFQLLSIAISYSIALFVYPEYFRTDVHKIILLVLAGHLMVSFSAYLSTANLLAFWNFNKSLFLRFFTSLLFSIVLFAGLAIALLSVEALFQLDLKGDIYFKLFIIIAAGFNSLFFLDGIPTDLTEIPSQHNYPKALKIFSQYVLIPLLTIYLLILLIYELKILFSMELPDGMVSILIIGYAVFGILSYLLIYPIREEHGNEWINRFSKLFFWFMFPLLILLFIAISVRISEYGITEMRYFIVVLASWLAGITLYFVIKSNPNIKVIPLSLFLASIISIFGPQSAGNISKKSQQSRLSQFIQSDDQSDENISIITYLVRYHGLTALEPLTTLNVSSVQNHVIKTKDSIRNSNFQKKSLLLDTAFSILNIDRHHFPLTTVNFINEEKYVRSNDFDITFWIQDYSATEGVQTPAGTITTSSPNSQYFYIIFNDTDSLQFSMDDFGKSLIKRYDSLQASNPNEKQINENIQESPIKVPRDWMILNASNSKYHAQIQVQKITIDIRNDAEQQNYFPYFSGYVLIKKTE